MSENTGIQWTDASYNPWTGCHKVSSGCRNCYMMRDKEKYGKDGNRVVRSKTTFNDPLKWKEPKLIFTCSWSDFFIEEADPWRNEVWEIIKKTPRHTYQILTKRPERIKDHLPGDWGDGYPNVWLGVSVENQKAAEARIPLLANVPAEVRFLSCEPLLSSIDLTPFIGVCEDWDGIYYIPWFNWVIVGGESGNDAGKWLYRECKPEWIYDIVLKCTLIGVPVFVKQVGTHLSKVLKLKDRHGGDIEEWPETFKIREFPKTI